MKIKNKRSNQSKPERNGSAWSQKEINALRQLAKKNAPTIVMKIALQRSEDSIYSKASKEGISLK